MPDTSKSQRFVLIRPDGTEADVNDAAAMALLRTGLKSLDKAHLTFVSMTSHEQAEQLLQGKEFTFRLVYRGPKHVYQRVPAAPPSPVPAHA